MAREKSWEPGAGLLRMAVKAMRAVARPMIGRQPVWKKVEGGQPGEEAEGGEGSFNASTSAVAVWVGGAPSVAGGVGLASGNSMEKVLPWPGSLCTSIRPPELCTN
jgi:hypothetical protein